MSSDPTRPNVIPLQDKRRENEIKGQDAQINSFAWPCCITCEHWEAPKHRKTGEPLVEQETCKLYEARPPATVILTGCVSYTPFIPF